MFPNDTPFLNVLRGFYSQRADMLKGKRLCVCLSGGADSVALLRGTLILAPQYGFGVCACHFNHMIRGAEADRDEKFCIELCEKLGVELLRGRDDVPAYAQTYRKSLEEAARECRYAYFKRNLDSERFDYYATAHNMNDDAETLIMNLVRGSGSFGAASIAEENGRLLRPMLKASRDEVEEFLHTLSQEYVFDSTNDSQEYTRNYIRKTVIPDLQKINPRVVEALSGFAFVNRADREFFESETEKYFDSDLKILPKSLRDRIILRKYKEFTGKMANGEQLKMLDRAVCSGMRNVLRIDEETEAVADSGRIEFFKSSETVPDYGDMPLEKGENVLFGGRITVFIDDGRDKSGYNLVTEQALRSENLKGGLYVRQRRTGDRIRVHGVNKSLKKLLIDKKIPAELRDIIPVICDEGGIVYIPFTAVADRVFTKNKENSVCVTVCGNIDKGRWHTAYEE